MYKTILRKSGEIIKKKEFAKLLENKAWKYQLFREFEEISKKEFHFQYITLRGRNKQAIVPKRFKLHPYFPATSDFNTRLIEMSDEDWINVCDILGVKTIPYNKNNRKLDFIRLCNQKKLWKKLLDTEIGDRLTGLNWEHIDNKLIYNKYNVQSFIITPIFIYQYSLRFDLF